MSRNKELIELKNLSQFLKINKNCCFLKKVFRYRTKTLLDDHLSYLKEIEKLKSEKF